MNSPQSPHSIGRTLLYLAMVGGATALLSWANVRWEVGGVQLVSFPDWPRATHVETRVEPEAVEALLAEYEVEEPEVADTLVGLAPPVLADWVALPNVAAAATGWDTSGVPLGRVPATWAAERAAQIRVPDSLHPNLRLVGDSLAFQGLWGFFEQASQRLVTGGPALHVLHFGDSQIEGDRITSELRHGFQQRWGGRGPGFVSAVPQAQVPGFVQTAVGWNRYTAFGKSDSTLGHQRYGLLATVGRADTSDTSAWTAPIAFRKRNMGHRSNRVWDALHVLASPLPDSSGVWIDCDSVRYQAQWSVDSVHASLHASLPPSCEDLAIRFAAPGPDLNAVGFYADSGVVVHNIPMRGSSGTIFRKAERAHWVAQLTDLDVGLVLLQYGGNAVPYIEDEAEARQYARWLASQIKLFQATLPEVPIALIGPSDMSTKDGLDFITYPQLLHVRTALQEMAWEHHVLFWDLFQVMGGANAMPAWVAADPPLAAADHIHFTNRGARRVGALLSESFASEFELWRSGLVPVAAPDSIPTKSEAAP